MRCVRCLVGRRSSEVAHLCRTWRALLRGVEDQESPLTALPSDARDLMLLCAEFERTGV